ncbi:HAD-IA family hydrolase [Levilactobacillus bambusae]|uniref:Beta-phosphoglucomutase family hydrolase n=1 Tax=Levilactobacillus bambusae TaxID=2024736 RepID=A0A2V1N1C8_9LACO|nr:HAD-IA family hydrolase [Levilactobacillus bambusae]PWG00120.1 beta-phosphoglucomutase family hydrolase [Levilactobacillus bambusae]
MSFNDMHGFLFDLHGVIADSWRYHLDSWHEIANQLEIPWTSQLERTLPGMSRSDSLEAILASVDRSAEFDTARRAELTDEENRVYQQRILEMSPANILPGIADFLASIRAAGYRMALASASTNAAAEIDQLQLTRYFPTIINAGKLAHSKPQPDIYLAAAREIGLSPVNCFGVEDTVTGLEAVNASGATPIAIGYQANHQLAKIQFENSAELSLAAIKQQYNQYY